MGIGTSSPAQKLEIVGGSYQMRLGQGGATGVYDIGRSTSTGIFQFYGNQTGTVAYTFGGVDGERMRIDASGNVGIGNSSPAVPLQIGNGTASATLRFGATSNSFDIGRDNATGYFIQNATQASPYNQFIWQQSGTERMRIDSSGNLLVGTTSGSTKMYVVDTSTSVSTARLFKNVASSQAIGALTIDKYDNTSTTAQIFVQFTINNQGTGSGQINANGASAAAFGSFSDSRLKENIIELPSQLANIMALRPVEFDYIESEGGGHQIGFIAQEVKEIYPDLVGERGDGMYTLTDMNKNDARLIKCIQEQQALITALTARITALEST